ncbi:hypothetical protein VTL71DRAFT_11407 [Oculimacula yallundae]|uniref:Uncharacterized protein n=1 Tax=Oculimacula yallundae TaxID=86028 RepID=A0ABR4CSL2_9HELO
MLFETNNSQHARTACIQKENPSNNKQNLPQNPKTTPDHKKKHESNRVSLTHQVKKIIIFQISARVSDSRPNGNASPSQMTERVNSRKGKSKDEIDQT